MGDEGKARRKSVHCGELAGDFADNDGGKGDVRWKKGNGRGKDEDRGVKAPTREVARDGGEPCSSFAFPAVVLLTKCHVPFAKRFLLSRIFHEPGRPAASRPRGTILTLIKFPALHFFQLLLQDNRFLESLLWRSEARLEGVSWATRRATLNPSSQFLSRRWSVARGGCDSLARPAFNSRRTQGRKEAAGAFVLGWVESCGRAARKGRGSARKQDEAFEVMGIRLPGEGVVYGTARLTWKRKIGHTSNQLPTINAKSSHNARLETAFLDIVASENLKEHKSKHICKRILG